MSDQDNGGKIDTTGKLLSSQERVAFKMISTGNDLHGQRAAALLAVDEGATQVQAAERAGLTPGQVKYWLSKFREIRLAIFPEQVLEAAGQTTQPEQKPEPLSPAEPKKEGKPEQTKAAGKKKSRKLKDKKGKKPAKKKKKKGKDKGKKKKKSK